MRCRCVLVSGVVVLQGSAVGCSFFRRRCQDLSPYLGGKRPLSSSMSPSVSLQPLAPAFSTTCSGFEARGIGKTFAFEANQLRAI